MDHFKPATASIGVGHFQAGDKTVDDILARADAASYCAKQDGRNRVITDEDEPQPGTG
uniref:GGDEF domain-containing protein n=1 Tax=uncultured Halomonas sp. TaxID=173971 RepID=UPI002602A307|nr:diguanylate cyclase [uncultured Halomonas sp.]